MYPCVSRRPGRFGYHRSVKTQTGTGLSLKTKAPRADRGPSEARWSLTRADPSKQPSNAFKTDTAQMRGTQNPITEFSVPLTRRYSAKLMPTTTCSLCASLSLWTTLLATARPVLLISEGQALQRRVRPPGNKQRRGGVLFERLRRGSWESNTGAWLRTAVAPKCSGDRASACVSPPAHS